MPNGSGPCGAVNLPVLHQHWGPPSPCLSFPTPLRAFGGARWPPGPSACSLLSLGSFFLLFFSFFFFFSGCLFDVSWLSPRVGAVPRSCAGGECAQGVPRGGKGALTPPGCVPGGGVEHQCMRVRGCTSVCVCVCVQGGGCVAGDPAGVWIRACACTRSKCACVCAPCMFVHPE